MAAISISSSSSGGGGAGASTSGSAPLSKLYNNPYSVGTLQYPSDLGGAQKRHTVTFAAMTTAPAGVETTSSSTVDPGSQSVSSSPGISVQPVRNIQSDVITLYMPDTINFNYAASYGNVSLGDAVKEVAGLTKIGGALTGAATSASASLLAYTQGIVLNPQQQLLFDGIDFRTFQMSFTFTPKNGSESSTIQTIIQKFRSHAAPKIGTSAAGAFFSVPDSFIISFSSPFITKLKESALMTVDVNYAPNGIWSAHPDGSPTQINMTLQFKELTLVDRTSIDAGF
jgi:hypothetical protein